MAVLQAVTKVTRGYTEKEPFGDEAWQNTMDMLSGAHLFLSGFFL